MRYLFLLILVVAGIYLFRTLSKRPPADPRPPETAGGNMVRCAHCGVYLPEDEAIRSGDRFYCSAEHRDRGTS